MRKLQLYCLAIMALVQWYTPYILAAVARLHKTLIAMMRNFYHLTRPADLAILNHDLNLMKLFKYSN